MPEQGHFPSGQDSSANADHEASLETWRQFCLTCRRCSLREGARGVVFGEGNPHAAIMFVGEGPGGDEDKLGRPFVGAAGRLLNRILTAAGLAREDVYITNVVKCRPPGNRLVMPTFHPAALLRDPHKKKAVWEDMQQVVKLYARISDESGEEEV
jgi:uracil-DNA glycosylase